MRYEDLTNIPIYNSHSHHLPDEEHRQLDLQRLFQNTYLNWRGMPVPSGDHPEEVTAWLATVRNVSFFVWLEKALMDLYGITKHLTADTWNEFDTAIKNAHQDKEWHIKILKEHCRYESICVDAFWNPGDSLGHPDLFRPAYRTNSIFLGYNSNEKDHNGNNFQLLQGCQIKDIEEYTDLVIHTLREKKKQGCVTLKCAIAYDRSLRFGKATKEQAQKAMCKHPDVCDKNAFQNYILDIVCQMATELNMPLQIHTGLGLMDKSNAMQLQPVIASHPETIFWLMHGSYPWISDIAGLTQTYSNVWADLCWLPLLSPTAAYRLMHELIDVCNADHVVWGCDTWTSEESYGARLAFLSVLSRVLSERVEMGMMRECDAMNYAKLVMYGNAKRILK